MDTCTYYASQSSITDPAEFGEQLDALPSDPAEVCQALQGLFIDYAAWYSYPVGTERLLQTNDHYVRDILKNILDLNKSPLTTARPIPERVYASTSDYVSLFCAVARRRGIPARKRVGYTSGQMFRSYDVAEYWDGKQWQQIDPAAMLEGEFLSAGRAWRLWRAGTLSPEQFRGDPSRGADVLLANLMLDLAAMNKVELLNWDRYGWMLRPFDQFSNRAWALLDRCAELLENSGPLEQLQEIYEQEEGVHVPEVIRCANPLVPPHQFELSRS